MKAKCVQERVEESINKKQIAEVDVFEVHLVSFRVGTFKPISLTTIQGGEVQEVTVGVDEIGEEAGEEGYQNDYSCN